jgi:hypothetical protein
METGSFFVVVPKSKCQPVRDLLRQQRVLDKGRQSWSGNEETVGIPVRWEQSQTEMFLELVTGKVGLALNELSVIARPNHERQTAATRISRLCQEVRVFASCQMGRCFLGNQTYKPSNKITVNFIIGSVKRAKKHLYFSGNGEAQFMVGPVIRGSSNPLGKAQ